ncbi:MAG: hypothetical protein L6Q54_01910 [Leptospiraceae bacterium]|nr:hypothetical protein [Leptospiraceae bacterium]MCK6379994.1 hypothetical protein [Leptospiraceae bacterium]NUM40163.1 hypothetical protein [Leptospiraceae bacterium]
MKNKKAILIFNPGSGKKKSPERALDFSNHWNNRFGSEIKLRATKSFSDIRISSSENSDYDIMIFMGGDGTLSECLQGVCEKEKFKPLKNPVGFLPGGTGNSFLRDFGISTYEEGRDALLDAIQKNQSINVDLSIVSYLSEENKKPLKRVCFNIFGLGVIPDAAETAIKMRFLGDLNYLVGVLKSAFTTKKLNTKANIDGKEEFLSCKALSINNSRYTGGAIEIAPAVRVNDGKLFLMIPEETSPLAMLNLFPMIMKGKHLDHPKVRTEFIKEAQFIRDDSFLMNIDGELEKGFNPNIKIQPDFWKLFMPKGRV